MGLQGEEAIELLGKLQGPSGEKTQRPGGDRKTEMGK